MILISIIGIISSMITIKRHLNSNSACPLLLPVSHPVPYPYDNDNNNKDNNNIMIMYYGYGMILLYGV